MHILLYRNIDTDVFPDPLGMGHLSQDPSIRAEDSFDRGPGTIGIPHLIHGGNTVGIAVLERDLAGSEQTVNGLLRRDEPALAVGSGVGIDLAGLHFLQPRGLVR